MQAKLELTKHKDNPAEPTKDNVPLSQMIKTIVLDNVKESNCLDIINLLIEQERHEQKQQRVQEIQHDIIELKKELKNIPKSNVGHHGHKYAPLDQYLDIVNPLMAKHNLNLHFDITSQTDTAIEMQAILSHTNGEQITSRAFFPYLSREKTSMSPIQAFGATLTYARRYILGMILNICGAGEDNDGDTGEVILQAPPRTYIPSHTAPIRQKQVASTSATTNPATEKQIFVLNRAFRDGDLDPEIVLKDCGVDQIHQVSFEKASQWISKIKG